MLTDLEVSSLACEYVFHKPENSEKEGAMELNFEGLEMQKWNIPMDRTQEVHEKMGSFV